MVRKPTATGLTASRDRLESIYGECVSKGVRAASTQIEAWREEIFTARVDQSNDAVFRSGAEEQTISGAWRGPCEAHGARICSCSPSIRRRGRERRGSGPTARANVGSVKLSRGRGDGHLGGLGRAPLRLTYLRRPLQRLDHYSGKVSYW